MVVNLVFIAGNYCSCSLGIEMNEVPIMRAILLVIVSLLICMNDMVLHPLKYCAVDADVIFLNQHMMFLNHQ